MKFEWLGVGSPAQPLWGVGRVAALETHEILYPKRAFVSTSGLKVTTVVFGAWGSVRAPSSHLRVQGSECVVLG